MKAQKFFKNSIALYIHDNAGKSPCNISFNFWVLVLQKNFRMLQTRRG